MGLFSGMWLMVLGVLGAASLIGSRRPDAQQYIDKLTPYQGWIGAISALWGAWLIISSVLSIGWLSSAPIFWITYFAVAVVLFSLGLLLGVGVLKTFITQPQVVQKIDQMIARLAPKQAVLGTESNRSAQWDSKRRRRSGP
jgi:hypothetical protein